MKLSLKIVLVTLLLVGGFQLKAQEEDAPKSNKREVLRDYRENIGVLYDKSWAFTFKYRTDGWQVGADYTKQINYFKSRIIQFDVGILRHAKQTRQSRTQGGGGLFGFNGVRPFVYGKQNTFISLHARYGRRHLLAERARKNGVMVHLQYSGGVTLGITKGYQLEVLPLSNGLPDPQANPITTGYIEGVDNGFTDYNRILGYSGFGKGFNDLGFQPGLNGNFAFQFDWSNRSSFIKALEAGFQVDLFFKDAPIMVTDNRFYFLSVYLGIVLGKKLN